MKKKPYYLKKYNEWMENGLPDKSKWYYGGLCGAGLSEHALFALMHPTSEDRDTYVLTAFWADEAEKTYLQPFAFTPLRQTIVLFLAAMNNEL